MRASAWLKSILRLTDGVGTGIGSWFDDNKNKVVGDVASSFYGQTSGQEMNLLCEVQAVVYVGRGKGDDSS